ncbi:hypothetical protein [uncultured Tessaracoccus sp.]|uniref:hypothetical protein n=1 Tax=uncultured Tessaracoccus sp. TaxID=905023 RepID=UPI00261DF0BE|nr:hypothetical protein [uncultured Tessaracoccus sp.]
MEQTLLIATAQRAARKAAQGREFIDHRDIEQEAIAAVLAAPDATLAAAYQVAYRAAANAIACLYDHHALSAPREIRIGFATMQQAVRESGAAGMSESEAIAAHATERNDWRGLTAETYARLAGQTVDAFDTTDPATAESEAERAVEVMAAQQTLRAAYKELGEVEREVLLFCLDAMRHSDKLPSLRTIAAQLGISKHAADKAIKTIRRILGQLA